MSFLQNLSFKNKLRYLLVSVSLITALVALFSANYIILSMTKKKIETDFYNYVNVFESTVENKFTELDQQAKIITADALIRSQLSNANNLDQDFGLGKNLQNTFQKVHDVFSSADFGWKESYEVLAFVNAEGQLIYSSVAPSIHSVDLRKNPLVEASLQNGWGGGFWSLAALGSEGALILPTSTSADANYLLMARSLYLGNRLMGVIIVGLHSKKTLANSFSQFSKGTVDFYSPSEAIFDVKETKENISTVNDNQIIKFQKNLFSPKSISSGTPLLLGGLRYEKSISDEVKNLQSDLLLLFAGILAFILILVTLTAQIFTRVLTAPLKTIEEGVRQFGQGNYHARIQVTTKDEFWDLAKAFNEMIEGFRLSKIDPLTEISNRRQFDFVFDKLWKRMTISQSKSPLSVALVDVDFFKKVNDTYGHPVGDEVLRVLSKSLSQEIRPQDIVARYGGEEFILLFPETDLEKACIACERIREAVEKIVVTIDSAEIKFTISVGVATHSHEFKNKEDLISKADEALYKAKHQGRNRVVTAI